jgi:hypothetical protein
MKYLCLIYTEEATFRQAMSPADEAAMMAEYGAFSASIQKSGHFLAGNRLEPSTAAVTIRIRDGKTSTTDGPFAETKEALGGFYMIDARDLNEAIQVASRIPGAKVGSIEVRPIAYTTPPASGG